MLHYCVRINSDKLGKIVAEIMATQSGLLKLCYTSRALSTVFNRVNPYFLRNANTQLIRRSSYSTWGEAYANLHRKTPRSSLQRSAWALHGVSLKENLLKEVQLEKYESEGKGLLSRNNNSLGIQHKPEVIKSKSIKTFDEVINDKPIESWSSTSRFDDRILSKYQKRFESKSPKAFNQDINCGIKESPSSALLSEGYILPTEDLRIDNDNSVRIQHKPKVIKLKSIKTFDEVINDKPIESWSSTSRFDDRILSKYQKRFESKSPKAFNQDINCGIKESPSSALLSE
ncbi:hypothetical protein GIB67_035032, partial [Kingdonia uniflora]